MFVTLEKARLGAARDKRFDWYLLVGDGFAYESAGNWRLCGHIGPAKSDRWVEFGSYFVRRFSILDIALLMSHLEQTEMQQYHQLHHRFSTHEPNH